MKWFIFWAAWGALCIVGAVLSVSGIAEMLYGIGALTSGANAQRNLEQWFNVRARGDYR